MTDTLAQDIVEGRRKDDAVLFENAVIYVSPEAFALLLESIANPREPTAALRDLMRRPAAWDEDPHAPDAHTFGG